MSEKPPLPADLIAEIDRLAPQLMILDHYRVLGVAESASPEELKAAYLRMLQRFHPGRWQAREGSAHHKRMEAIFARATEAYEVLRRPDRKLEYDRALARVRGVARASAAPGVSPATVIARPERRAPSAAVLAAAARMIDQHRPTQAPTVAPTAAPPESAAPTGPPRPLILVVEDDETLRRMLARILEELGEVHVAADGAEALAFVAKVDRLPRLVVTDVMMPNVDGLELARRLKADPRTSRVPIVMLTAKQGPKDMIDGVNAGARLYLTKPFKVDELKAKAKKAMG